MVSTLQRIRHPDLREIPAYNYVEAGRALNIPATTIGAWVRGQSYRRKDDMGHFAPVIKRPDPDDTRLSFSNLIEAHVLRSLRTAEDEVPLRAVRAALDIAEKKYDIDRLLINRQLRFGAGKLFLDTYEGLVELTATQQLVMRDMFAMYLDAVEYDEHNLPREFYPLTHGPKVEPPKIIAMSPYMSFGKPFIRRVGISTDAIRSRIDAGEDREHVAGDFGLTPSEINEALRYEVAA